MGTPNRLLIGLLGAFGCGPGRAPTAEPPAASPVLGELDTLGGSRATGRRPDAVVDIDMAHHAMCVRFGDGRVGCGGSNSGLLIDSRDRALDSLVLSDRFLETDRDIALGSDRACALDTDGRVRCWGSALWGGRGDGCTLDRDANERCDEGPPPERSAVVSISGLPEVQMLSEGGDSVCVLTTTGEVWCWGANIEGDLGVPDVESAARPQRVEVPTAAELQSGAHHSCIVAERSRDVWCWGYHRIDPEPNPYERALMPRKVGVLSEGGRLDVVAWGVCLLDADHQARCWGRLEGREFSEPPYSFSAVADIEGGTSYTCMLSTHGSVACLDGGEWSTLDIPLDGSVARLYGSLTSVCALSEAGDVACWGEGTDGLGFSEEVLESPTRVRFDALRQGDAQPSVPVSRGL